MRRLAAVVVVLALAGCHDHPTPKPTPTPTTSASPSPSPDVTPTPTPTVTPTTSPSPSASTPPGGFPTPETTGAPVETGLPAGSCSLGAGTFDGMLFDCSTLEVRSGTIIRNSVILGEIKGDPSGPGFTVEDSTIMGNGCAGAAAVGNSNYTLRRVHIKGFNDGARAEGPDVRVYDSLIEICFSAGGHADGLQVCPASAGCGGSNDVSGLVFHHNRVSHPKADSTGAVFVMGGSSGGRVTDNLMSGFSITLRVHGAGYVVTGNRIVDGSWLYGAVDCDGATQLTWSDNRLITVNGYTVTSTGAEVSC